MNNENNPPAFPSHGSMGEVVQEGLSLRDYFAARALVVSADYLSNATPYSKAHGLEGVTVAELAAREAYAYADAMLAARLSA